MRRALQVIGSFLLLAVPLLAQDKRLWVLRAPGEMVEYDLSTFAAKQTVKVPAEAVQAPRSVSVNRMGQILFAPGVSLPLADSDVEAPHKVWSWNGRAAATFDLGVKRENAITGSNQAVTELAPEVHLAADGGHLFGCGAAAGEQEQDRHVSHATSLRCPGKPKLCVAFAGREPRRYGPPRRRNGVSSEEREPAWSTFSMRSMRNYAPNARSNC